jgi:putative ABC transport system permease protein
METIWNDLRYGWRMLRRNPGFTAVAILTLAVGIGANAAIFSIINTVLLRPLPFPDSNRIVLVWETYANRNVTQGIAAPPELLDWRAISHSFTELSGFRAAFLTLTGSGEPEQLWGVNVSANFFRLLGVKPVVGRDFLDTEDQPGNEGVVVVSYGVWQRRFGGAPGVIGKNIILNEKPYMIVGVLPQGFSVFGTTRLLDIWMPLVIDRAHQDREAHSIVVFGRLKPDVSIPQAQAEMETIFEQLKKQYPGVNQKDFPRVASLQSELAIRARPGLLVLLAAVGFVLLIACANVANLMLARAASREREIAVRSTLGAGRRRILRQLLTESALLSLIGGAFGILVAYGGLHLLRAALPPPGGPNEIPRAGEVGIDGAVLAFTLVVSLLTGIIFGLAPAIQVSHSDLSESLKEGGRGSTGGRRSHWTRSALVVSEVALSLILLVGAGLLIRSFVLLMSEDIGFNPSHVLSMLLWLPETHYTSSQPILNFYQQLVDRVEALPGVKAASAVNFLPLTGWRDYCDFDIAGRATPPSGEQFTAQYRVTDWRYRRAMEIPLKEGRDFTSGDGPNSQGVVLINESLARRYWSNEDPVGKQIRPHFLPSRSAWQPQPSDSWVTIVGVVADVREWEWDESNVAQLYLPFAQNPSHVMRIVMRSDGDSTQLASAVRRIVDSLDQNQPVTEVRTMDEFLAAAVSQRRMSMLLLGVFAGVATLLAAVGIYGVMAYAVSQRSHEIGIRMALGAEPRDVLQMVVGDGMRLAGIGLALGVAGSFLAMRYLQSQLYGVKATDPLTLGGVAAGLAIVAAAACYFPARRATRVDPLVALRYE